MIFGAVKTIRRSLKGIQRPTRGKGLRTSYNPHFNGIDSKSGEQTVVDFGNSPELRGLWLIDKGHVMSTSSVPRLQMTVTLSSCVAIDRCDLH